MHRGDSVRTDVPRKLGQRLREGRYMLLAAVEEVDQVAIREKKSSAAVEL